MSRSLFGARSRVGRKGAHEMSTKRAACTLSQKTCAVLLKAHVASLTDEAYLQQDLDLLVKKYVGFLVACAQQTERLNKDIVATSAVEIFACNRFVAEQFGTAMKSALSHCHSKGSKATSGARLTSAVRSVVLAFKSSKGSLMSLALQNDPPSAEKSAKGTDDDDDDVRATVASQSRSSGSASAYQLPTEAEINELYGCSTTPPEKKARIDEDGTVDIVSSQEVEDVEAAPAVAASAPQARTIIALTL